MIAFRQGRGYLARFFRQLHLRVARIQCGRARGNQEIKNVIDYLYNEWIGKPLMIVTYGALRGNSASDAWKHRLKVKKLRVVDTRPQLKFAEPGQDDLMLAAGSGKVGDNSSKKWEEKISSVVEKAWGR